MIAVVEVATESLVNARNEAKKVVSMANMRGIGQAIYIYAADRKARFPESLEEMLRVAPNTITLESFSIALRWFRPLILR
ncbi:MAG: hypothetical protein IPK83_12665 [Planctomycetes bacterium]|nr:hypothetical protein [Planctomycetota bacterium]